MSSCCNTVDYTNTRSITPRTFHRTVWLLTKSGFSVYDMEVDMAMATDGDFFAAYDKKMLWRANLYIDEEVDDWNDINPWNAPLNENNWNKTTYSSYQQSNGGQVLTPASFTWINDSIHNNVVAYDYWGQDSPHEFNEKMRQQQNILNYYITNGSQYTVNGVQQEYTADPNGWTETIAPQNNHSSYLYSSNYPYSLPNAFEQDAHQIISEPVFINSSNLYPYVPGLSNVYRMNIGSWPPWNTQYLFGSHAAGLDCVGLVQRCASYPNTAYIWTQSGTTRHLSEYMWGDTRGNTVYPTPGRGYSWEIISEQTVNQNPQILSLIVPGDIVYYGDSHIAIVKAITYTANTRNTNTQSITLIESTVRQNNWGNVFDGANIQFYTFLPDWVIVRLCQ